MVFSKGLSLSHISLDSSFNPSFLLEWSLVYATLLSQN